jgi:hypothetical protein
MKNTTKVYANLVGNIKKMAYEKQGNKCYFKDKYCKGELELDHKISHDHNKNGMHTGRYGDAVKNPYKYWLLCQFHNRVKYTISYDKLNDVLSSMLTTLQTRIGEQ